MSEYKKIKVPSQKELSKMSLTELKKKQLEATKEDYHRWPIFIKNAKKRMKKKGIEVSEEDHITEYFSAWESKNLREFFSLDKIYDREIAKRENRKYYGPPNPREIFGKKKSI